MEHANITDPYIHEPKGASTAANGKVLTANGDGSTSWQTPVVYSNVKMGWYDYNDLATTTTPIPLTTAGTYYDLTNDGLGVNTQISYGISDIANIWNASTGRFDFSGLDVGDTIDLRVDANFVTTSANTALEMSLEVATGTGSAFYIPLITALNIKAAANTRIIGRTDFYLGSTTIKNNPARLRVKADATGSSIIVNGWFVRVIKRG